MSAAVPDLSPFAPPATLPASSARAAFFPELSGRSLPNRLEYVTIAGNKAVRGPVAGIVRQGQAEKI